MEGGEWRDKVTNEVILERIGEKTALLNNILRRKVNWIRHILGRKCFLHDATEGQRVGRVGRRFYDVLRNRR